MFTLSRISSRAALAAVVAAAAVTLSACGDSEDGSSGGEEMDIAMLSVAGDPGFNTYELGAQKAADAAGVNLEIGQVTNFSGDTEIAEMNALAARNPDAMITTALNAPAIQATLEELADRGIKIVVYDTAAEDQEAIPAPYVASQYRELGEVMGDHMAKMIGETGSVLYLGLQPGNLGLDAHQQGFYDALKKYPDVEVLPVAYDGGENSKAASIVSATLASDPDLAGVYAGLSSAGADGAYSALTDADAYEEGIKVQNLDANPDGIAALKAGKTDAIGSFDLFGVGELSVETAVKVVNGEDVPPVQELPACLITRENLTTPESKQCYYIEEE